MRFANLADVVLRGGHLSDRALVDVCMNGERPPHMDRCDICAERAIEFGRWLDDVRAAGEAEIDAVFPAERLAAQQGQIMRRLEQLDQPARVIAFPKHMRPDGRQDQGRRVAPGWVIAAAAAGLVLGIVGDHWSSRFSSGSVPTTAATTMNAQANAGVDPEHQALIDRVDQDADRAHFASLDTLEQITPRALPESAQGSGITFASLTTGGRRDK